MKYVILYSSKTGNTEILAKEIRKTLIEDSCLGIQNIDKVQEAENDKEYEKLLNLCENADRVYIGFWTDKGSCDEKVQKLLSLIKNKEIFLFGTAGFGGADTYFQTILQNVMHHMDQSNHVVGTFMCQGKMPYTVRQRYEKMKEMNTMPNADEMIANFDRALSHPSEDDLIHMKKVIEKNEK